MTVKIETEYRAVSPFGRIIHIFQTRALGDAWFAKRVGNGHSMLFVEVQTITFTTELETSIWEPYEKTTTQQNKPVLLAASETSYSMTPGSSPSSIACTGSKTTSLLSSFGKKASLMKQRLLQGIEYVFRGRLA